MSPPTYPAEIKFDLTAEGDLSDFTEAVLTAIAAALADLLGIDASALVLAVLAGSVEISVTITTDSAASSALAATIDSTTPDQVTTAFANVTVGGSPLTVTDVSAAAVTIDDASGTLSGGEASNIGGTVGAIIGGSFVPLLMCILWLTGAFEKYGCASPCCKKKENSDVTFTSAATGTATA